MDKFKKIDKEFLLTDSSLNSYSYRLLTSGYQLADFKKNPIGYYMHGTKDFPREQGVLVKWEDLRHDNDKVFGKPCINLSHPRGQRTADEIESGFLNAASVGHIVALEISSNPSDYLEGQQGPTVSKWFNREASLVDIPGNYNALTDLVDENENPINLADFKKNLNKMEKIFLTPVQLILLNLKADAPQTEIDSALSNLVATAGKVPKLTSDLAAAHETRDKAVGDLAAFKKTTTAQTIKDLLATAVTEGKVTKEGSIQLEKDYEGRPEDLKNLIGTFKKYESVTGSISDSKKKASEENAKKTWDQLDKENKLTDLKAKDFDLFKEKYQEKFGKEYKEAK